MAKSILRHIMEKRCSMRIYLNDEDSSYSEKVADPLTDEFDAENEKQTIHVMEYQVREH